MKLTNLTVALSLSSLLAGCGGGGDPTSTVDISPPRTVPSASSIGSVDMPINSDGFIAAIRNVSADGKADALDAVAVFRWMNNHQNYDIEYMRNYEVDIEGTTYNLYDAYHLLLGYKRAYYDGKESFWQTIINTGTYNDEDATFADIQLFGLHATNEQLLAIGRGEKTVDQVVEEIAPAPVETPEEDDNDVADGTPGTPTPGAVRDANEYRTSEFLASNILSKINADVAWSRGWTGNNVKIVVADTGARISHNDLDDNIADTWNFVAGNDNVTDTIGHGTHVAGIIAAEMNGAGMIGVAPDAKLMIAKVSYGDGSIHFGYAKQATIWGRDAGAVASNLSIALPVDYYYTITLEPDGEGSWYSTNDYYGTNGFAGAKLVAPEWKQALGTDMVLVKAAGNAGMAYSVGINQMATATDDDGNLILDGQMIIVGNWDINNDRITPSSNQAGSVCTTYDKEQAVCKDAAKIKDFYIMAPGISVFSTDSDNDTDYALMSGTSMSAAVVSGAVAVVHQMWPHMKGKYLVQLLLETADKTVTNYDENIHGQGLLDLDRATQPVGATGIPTSGRTDGAVADITGGVAGTISLASVASSTMVLDSYERDFYIDLSQATATVDTRKTSFVKDQTTGEFTGSIPSFAGPAKNIMGTVIAGYNQDHFAIGKQYGNWELGFVNEKDSLLGNQFSGVFALGENTRTVYGAYNASKSAFGLDFTGRAEVGYSVNNADATNSLVTDVDNVTSVALHAGMFKSLGNYRLGATASIPTRIVSGDLTLDVPVSRTLSGDVVTQQQTAHLNTGFTEVNLGISARYVDDNQSIGAYAEQRINYAGTDHDKIEYGVKYELQFNPAHSINEIKSQVLGAIK